MKLRSAVRHTLVLGLLAVLGTTVTSTATATADPASPPNSQVDATGRPRSGWEAIGPNSIGGMLGTTTSPTRLAMMEPAPPMLWLSDDRGASWSARRELPQDTVIQAFVVNPTDDNRMLAIGTKQEGRGDQWRGKLLATTDRGRSWQTLQEWWPEGAFQLAADPSGRTIAVMQMNGVSISTDGGASWRVVPRTWPREGIAAPLGDQRMTMVGDDLYFTTVHPEYSLWAVRGIHAAEPKAERVYRAEDEVNQVASDGRQLVVTVGAELRGSADGGKTWTVLRRDPAGQRLREPRFVNSRLYTATYQDLDVSTDGGRTWARKPVPSPGEGVTDIADLPAGAGKPAATLISALYRGVYTDKGKAGYEQIGVPGESMRELVTTGSFWQPQSLVAAGMQEIYNTPLPRGRITPSTRVWQSHPEDRLHENALLSVSPNRPDVVWQVTKNGFNTDVLRSGDGGKTWQLINHGLEGAPHAFLVNPADPDRMLLSAFSMFGYVTYRSDDAGKHWERTDAPGFLTLAGDSWNRNRIWGGGTDGLYRSDDGGKTWTQVSDEPTTSLAVSRWGEGRVLAGGAGLRLSTDNGRTFRQVREGAGNPREFTRILAHPFDPRVWFASRIGEDGVGVLRSIDFGRTWSPLPGAMPDSRVVSLAISADGGQLFAGTSQSGAYRLTLY